jgi:beta-lactamase regulating signal transducer with metallopeptidase domain
MIDWAVETLLATSLLMATVLLLRNPVARLFGARAAYALWLAPALRLLLPPMPEGGPIPEIIILTAPGAAAVPVSTGMSMIELLLFAWLGGAAVFLILHALQHRWFVADAIASGRRLPIHASGPELIESPAVEGPIATGVIRQRIFIPAGFADRLTEEQQRLALAHERLHHRRGDLFALAASLVVLALHWFNPLAHYAQRAFRRDLEAACDAELIERIGGAERADYARAIVGCAAVPVPRAICTLTTIDDLKRRLTMLDWNHGKLSRTLGLGCAAALAAAGLSLGTANAATQDKDSATTEKVEKRVIIRNVGEGPMREPLSADMREKIAKCEGQPFEANADLKGEDGKQQRTRVVLCTKGGDPKMAAERLEKVVTRIEGDSDMSPEAKAKILADLRAKISELRNR